MLSRERVLSAIEGRTPDRTPRDFWAEKAALNRLFDHLGHRDEERLLSDLGIDLRHLNAREPEETEAGPGVFQNFWGERYIYRRTPWGPVREDIPGALSGARSLAEIESHPFPTPDCLDHSHLKAECLRHGQYALLYGFADIWQRPGLVRGWENWFLDLAEHPDWVHFLARKFTDFYREDYTRAADATDGQIDLYLVISDLGSQRGPLISREMFREFVAPYLKEMVDLIHSFEAKVMFHSCGKVRPFIPDLIALGIDVLDPIQPAGPEMSPESLRAEFGDRLCFHGGIDMQGVLARGTAAEVRAEARRYCEAFAGGRYILAPSHLFQPDVPPPNILAMYDPGGGPG